MSSYTSYWLYQKYEKRGDQDWIPVYPNVYSVDGDGTKSLVIRRENDYECGYHCDTQYRWIPVPIQDGYICDECDINIEYRWVSTSAYTYFGDYRYEILQEQFKKEGGEWQDLPYTKYGNPVKVAKKIKVTFNNGDIYAQSCGTDDGVWYSFNEYHYGESGLSNVFKIEFGDCVTELGWRYRNSGYDCGKSYWDNDIATSGERIRDYLMSDFSNCGVRELVFSEGLRWIGGYGIFSDNKLINLTLPSTVESIGFLRAFDQPSPRDGCIDHHYSYTFSGNKYLKNVTLNEGLKSIGGGDFQYCTSIERIDLPSTLEKIGDYIFSGCTNLKQIVFKSENPPEKNCTDDSIHYTNQCRIHTGSTLSASDDTFIYIPCGSLSAYSDFLSDMPSDRIVEYSGSCSSIPSIDSMYNVLFTYKIGTGTTNVYRGLTGSTPAITASTDFTDVIDGYADEITIPAHTEFVGTGITTVSCGKLTLQSTGYTNIVTLDAEEIIIDTSDLNVTLYGSNNTRKVTVTSGSTPMLWGCFRELSQLEEIYIDGNPTLKNAAFSDCQNLHDIYITYTGSVINVIETSIDVKVLDNTNPTVHVPCNLYENYLINNFWSRFNIVKEGECPSEAYFVVSSNTFSTGCSTGIYNFIKRPVYCGTNDEMVIVCSGITQINYECRYGTRYGNEIYFTFYKDGVEDFNTKGVTEYGSVRGYSTTGLNDGNLHTIRIVGNYPGYGVENMFTYDVPPAS